MDYFAHDAVYRTLRERGAEGWSSEEEVRALFDHILPWLPSPAGRGASLLELGCGAGSLSLLLAAQGHTVTGIDIAPTAIQWAWERPQSVGLSAQFQVGDVVTLSPFADAVFDTFVDGHCLHEPPDDFQSGFRFEPCFVFVFGKPVLEDWISRQATQHSMAA